MVNLNAVVVDTNVILRLLLADIKDQYEKAKALFRQVEMGKKKIFISVLVVNELIWIMENYYEKTRGEYLEQVMSLLALKNVKLFDADKKLVVEALRSMLKYNLDFTDLYIWKTGMDIVSFDKQLNKLI